MKSEIGSNFWEYSVDSEKKNGQLWWETEEYSIEYFKSGRNAIKAFCRLIKVPTKSVLLPIYTCSTVIDPFVDEGWDIHFYCLNKDLTLNRESLIYTYEINEPSVVFFHSYFGLDTLKNDLGVIKDLQAQGAIIVEDITQSLFSNHNISFANYYVSSLRKYLAIPDGGFLASKQKIPMIEKISSSPEIVKTAFDAFGLKARYFEQEEPKIKDEFRSKYQELNLMIGKNEQIIDISPESLQIFASIDFDMVKRRRVENYRYLLHELEDLNFIKPVLSVGVADDAPLYLPVYVENVRKDFQAYLASNRVYCPIIWPRPLQIQNADQVTEYMYQNMLCFPIDQRYGIEEMSKVVNLARDFVC